MHYNKFPNLGVCQAKYPNLKDPRAPSQNCKKIPASLLLLLSASDCSASEILVEFQCKLTFVFINANNCCDAGQVPILRYFKVWRYVWGDILVYILGNIYSHFYTSVLFLTLHRTAKKQSLLHNPVHPRGSINKKERNSITTDTIKCNSVQHFHAFTDSIGLDKQNFWA